MAKHPACKAGTTFGSTEQRVRRLDEEGLIEDMVSCEELSRETVFIKPEVWAPLHLLLEGPSIVGV